MAARRARRTPLTLAVLSLLNEQPRHPYEMQALIRDRHIADVVRMRGGSLYDAIARLTDLGLAEATGTSRAGARPERTVYAITDAGRAELRSLLREYLGTRAEEYPVFAAGLAHAGHLPRDEVQALLRTRADELEGRIEEVASNLAAALAAGIPKAVLLETDYAQALRRAELAWLRETLRAAEADELGWGQSFEGAKS
ncbi:PadR family transcriptional regulator [Amycolatopsis anabasis]|uniref:PadR family transcriptional regulator n=1 Tax=Amycolatopsis anabasis TaxID=1840409 RepID=UPI001FEC1699|nr:PadR family transcriptional regulator [Amycolatopsis anabasis]